jgi:C1A family cysteine protease
MSTSRSSNRYWVAPSWSEHRMLSAEVVCDFRAAQTPVRGQGQRSTCSVFAATAAHEWMAGDKPHLSEEDALCSAKLVDPGPGDATWVASALRGVATHDQALSTAWPYGRPHYSHGRPASAVAGPRRACGAVQTASANRVADVARILGSGRAAVLTVRFVPQTWSAATPHGWIDDPDPPVAGAHAVLAVGCMAATPTRPDAVVFKNSWTDKWGRLGYGFLTDRYLAAHHQLTDVLEVSPS